MEFLTKYPLQTLALLLGGGAIATATGMSRHQRWTIALLCGAIGVLILVGAASTILRDPDWGAIDDLTPDTFDRRQRTSLILVAIGMLAGGVAAMWVGFGPGTLIGQILLVGGGFLLLLAGVLALTTWLQMQRVFG